MIFFSRLCLGTFFIKSKCKVMIVVAHGVCQQITICAANSFNSEMFVTHRDHDADDLMRRTHVRCYLELKLSIVRTMSYESGEPATAHKATKSAPISI